MGERERERVRIASDLHDVVLQRLGAAQLQADNIASAIRLERFDQAQTLAEALKHEMAEVIADVRRAIADTLRDRLDAEDLPRVLERHARSFQQRTDIPVSIHVECSPPADIPATGALLLSHAAEEALRNVATHAGASQVELRLQRRDDVLELRIRDNGRGPVDDEQSRPHLGLDLIQEEAELAGGGASLVAHPEGGAEIVVWLRLPAGTGG